jgi:hypothetical protein
MVLNPSENQSFPSLPRRVWYSNHCISPSFVDEIIAYLGTVPFQKGQPGTGRENSLMRITHNNCEGAIFPIGRGPTCVLYDSLAASEMELKILKVFNTIMGVQNNIATAASTNGKPRIRVVDNVLQKLQISNAWLVDQSIHNLDQRPIHPSNVLNATPNGAI